MEAGTVRKETATSALRNPISVQILTVAGWSEMITTISANFAALEQIRQDAEARLAETDGDPIPATFAMLGFESPPPTEGN